MSRLRFDTPASTWLEALPLGNGVLGAMAYGDPAQPRFALNHTHGWSGGPVPAEGGAWAAGLDRPALLAELRAAVRAGDHAEADRLAKLFQDGDVSTFLPLGELVLEAGEGADLAPVVTPAQSEGSAPCTTDDRRRGVGECERVLDLATAVHASTGRGLTHETFVSADAGALLHRITGPAALRRAFRPVFTTRLREDERHEHAAGADVLVRFPVSAQGGSFEWSDERASVTVAVAVRIDHGADETLVALAAVSDYVDPVTPPHGRVADTAAEASAAVERAVSRGWDALLAEHLATHGELWNRTRLELPLAEPSATVPAAIERGDPVELTQLQFDHGRYLLIASSRTGGLPPTLQGLWNAELAPPWRSNFTININTEMNHWSAAPTGLAECAAPLLDLLEGMAVTGADAARRLYGARGFVAHHNSDAWAYAGQSGTGSDSPSWAFWPFGAAWLTLTACELLDFGPVSDADRARLARLVAGCAEFLLDWLQVEPGGVTTVPSTSPENEFATDAGGAASLAQGSTMDLALARALFARCVVLAREQAVVSSAQSGAAAPCTSDDRGNPVVTRAQSEPPTPCTTADWADIASRARGALELLPAELPFTDEPEPEVREWGGAERGVDPHHRHVSHLVGVYPLRRALTEDERLAVTRTLERRGDDSTGWSLAWKAALWARLGRGDKVGDILALTRRAARAGENNGFGEHGGLYPNLFAAHPPFQIDANL
ncbi:MAG: glycoside hydrolase family 95 protein, partial [Microbacteriaceae bacterium]|nr:glycoside hydrolase family 95 protein [Microbacteriaceae bacterium]